jgi:hypothetical protein
MPAGSAPIAWAAALALVGLMLVSSRDYPARFPLLDGAVVPLLEDRHRKAAFLGSWGFHVLAAAATGGTSFASDNPPTAGQIEAARAMTPAGTPLLYLRVERPRGSRRAGMPSATWSGAATPCRSETVTS